jgi:hypothetical protein
MPRDFLSDFGEVKENKTFMNVTKNGKVAYISKKRVSLQEIKPEYSSNAKTFTDQEIKQRHLGKVKCIVKFKNEDELKQILTAYFKD